MQLLYMGIHIPEQHDNSNWTHAFRNWIRSLELEFHTGNFALQNLLEEFEFIDKNIRTVSNELRKYCRKHYKNDYFLLRSIPGIGGIVACGILAELGDLRRFKKFQTTRCLCRTHPMGRAKCRYKKKYGTNLKSKPHHSQLFCGSLLAGYTI